MNELMELRVSQDIPAIDMVNVVREFYPRFDKPLLSKCQHHELYGIDLRSDAMEALRARYAIPAVATPPEEPKPAEPSKPIRRDTHRLIHRVSCRLEDGEYDTLLNLIKADGFDTMQSWLCQIVRRYIRRRTAKEQHNV